MISPTLLRAVRTEIQGNLSFTPKETDIYKIHQSGDLANLDGLDDSSLKLLPSLLTLRDALYSSAFRSYLSDITGAGELSGKKTDMAINVYTPGCHLLCHDDVIGSRRVSYILYLTDPDRPWEEDWGGALRLYPTQTHEDKEATKVPSPDFTTSIPPAFNQLSFFAVQPGESFHDVEEVYAPQGVSRKDRLSHENLEPESGRVRMAISGWYHIPQEGENGYQPGLEQELAEKSSLTQLQGKGDAYDLPQPRVCKYQDSPDQSFSDYGSQTIIPDPDAKILTESDCDFLLRYLTPTYLTPDTISTLSSMFADNSVLRLDSFLKPKFAEALRSHILLQESESLPTSATEIESRTPWKVARPPHKHRYLYMQTQDQLFNPPNHYDPSLLHKLLNDLFPSQSFRKWLQLATSLTLTSHDVQSRRFRRGKDYTLATNYTEESSRVEITLGITPTKGCWGDDDDIEHPDASNRERKNDASTQSNDDSGGVGGYEVYMAGDESDDNDDNGSNHGISIPSRLNTNTGARASGPSAPRPPKAKADPAVYRATDAGDEDDGVLFSMPAGWNRLSVVLRDKGVLRFVKYVSRAAKGDRWDVVGEFGVNDEEEDNDEGDGGVGVGVGVVGVEEDDDDDNEGGWAGFESSDESSD